jgi:HD-GYP domain-containing protein (c-di-GMP phosphodiesterase class II)
MNFKVTGRLGASSLGVSVVAFAFALAAIGGVWTLQKRASASRDNQVQLNEVERDFSTLQGMPYDIFGAANHRVAPAVVLTRMRALEADIHQTLAGLPSNARSLEAGPYKANLAVLERIRLLLSHDPRARVDVLAVSARILATRVNLQLEVRAAAYRAKAESSLRLAIYGSAGVILTLVSLFVVFYLRGRRLVRDNARLLLHDSQMQVIQRLATAAEFRDDETGQHTRRVGRLSATIGAELGLPADQLQLLAQAAALHDVGKIGIPDSILLKPGRLTRGQLEHMKAHTTVGASLLAGRDFPLLAMAEEIALSHHERWDGTGYPARIAGTAIPLVGRIVAVADVFDALTHERPYKHAWSIADALAEIVNQKGKQFDPHVVNAFLRVIPTVLADIDGESLVPPPTRHAHMAVAA